MPQDLSKLVPSVWSVSDQKHSEVWYSEIATVKIVAIELYIAQQFLSHGEDRHGSPVSFKAEMLYLPSRIKREETIGNNGDFLTQLEGMRHSQGLSPGRLELPFTPPRKELVTAVL